MAPAHPGFLEDFKLVDPSTESSTRGDLDRIFISVDVKASKLAKEAAQAAAKAGRKAGPDLDEKKALKRVEFLSALVQVAQAKFIKSGACASIAEATHRLLVDHIDPLVNYDMLPDPNLFRRSCYVKTVSAELAAFEDSLRPLHAALAEFEFGAYSTRLGSRTWIKFMRAINFILGVDLSERDCNLCFVWARMAVAATPGPKDDALPFEGFLEALCRLASIKALPTDEEISAAGCEDAGKYVMLMYQDEDTKAEYETMLRERTVGWGGKPSQPLDRCVAHTLSIIVHSMEATLYKGTSKRVAAVDGELTDKEVDMWMQLKLTGIER